MIVRESLITEQNKLQLSAGLVILQDQKILLAHPTGAEWYGTYSIPKGHVETGEELIETAIRETREEIGITINLKDINKEEYFIDYTKKGKVFKRVYYFIVNNPSQISEKNFKLQKKEVDWAGFLDKKEAQKRIFWRLKDILKHL